EDGEEPGTYRAGRPEEPAPGNRTLQTILHEVIGEVGVARQRAGIAPQRGHAGLDLVDEVAQEDRSRRLLDGKMPDATDAVTGDVAGLGVIDPVVERHALIGPHPGAVSTIDNGELA